MKRGCVPAWLPVIPMLTKYPAYSELIGKAGWDYVLIARAESTTHLPFDNLKTDLNKALARLHSGRG